MNVEKLLGPGLLNIAQAVGLVSNTGELDPSWFDNPIQCLESMLTNEPQRVAVLDLLNEITPPQVVSGTPQDERWHPLLGSQPSGNVFLTVDDSGPIIIGIGGQYSGSGSPPKASMLFKLPIASLSGSSFSAVSGTSSGPLTLTLAVTLGWTTPTHPIGLAGVTITLYFAPRATPAIANIAITLQELDLDGKGANDVVLDPRNLSSEATKLIIGLVREKLTAITASASSDALAVAVHLIPLLGLDGSLPLFPFETVGTDPKALTTWLQALLTGSPAPMQTWLSHFAGLLGVSAPNVIATTSASGASWSVTLFTPNSASSVKLTLVQSKAGDGVTPQLGMQVELALLPSGSAPVRLDANVTLLTLPLVGTLAPSTLTSALLAVTSPADPSQKLIAPSPGATFTLDSLRVGLRWNGTGITPLLELQNVIISGTGTYPVIDLTNANTVVASASASLASAIVKALGSTGPGMHLAALIGLVEPNTDSSAPLIDPIALAAHPTNAIATLHRNALLSTTHPWLNYFGELVALLSLPGAITGNGTHAEPWNATVTSVGPLTLQLVAYNAQTSGDASNPQLLRIGLRILAVSPSLNTMWTTELFAVDLQATGPSPVTLLGGHHASVTIVPGAAQTVSGIAISANSFIMILDVMVGSMPHISAIMTGLTVTTLSGTLNVPTLAFPFTSGFDVGNPMTALGISVADLEQLLFGLLVRELNNLFGGVGLTLAVLIGCGTGLPGLQADFPALADQGRPGSLFGDPLGALQVWISRVAGGLSSDGSDFASTLVAWLAGLLASSPNNLVLGDVYGLDGVGTYDDPWVLPIGASDSQAAGLLWLEPAGPPNTASLAVQAIDDAADFPEFVDALVAARRYIAPPPDGLASSDLATALQSLSDHLTTTDGVVPVESQIPTGGTWTSGIPVGAPHHLQPHDPSACTQILNQVNTWAMPGSARAILLLGPAFSDHTTWSTLLVQAETAHPGTTSPAANFNLRISGVNPALIDLRPVIAVADYYTADLQDDGSGDTTSLVQQIGLILARLATLKPGASIIIVAHSTAGVAARAYVAANSAHVKGLITLGTPHTGAPLVPLTVPATAEALQTYRHFFPNGVAAGPLHDALQHLLQALDGYLPASAGALPTPWPYPIGDFTGSSSSDTGGVPALALGGQLGGASGVDLLGSLQAAATGIIGAFTVSLPTHLAYGILVGFALGPDSGITVQATMRVDSGRITLQAVAPEPPRSAQVLTISTKLMSPGGWLVGGPLSYAGLAEPLVDVRVRSADLGMYVMLKGGALSATPQVQLHDAAFHGITNTVIVWGDALLDASLGSIFQTIAADTPSSTTSLGALLTVLEAFGITVPDPPGVGISADALNALGIDPLGYLAPKVIATFAAPGIPGLTASTRNSYVLPFGTLPLEAFVLLSPATVGLRTTPSTSGLTFANGVELAFSLALPLATMKPAVSALLTVDQVKLVYASDTLTIQMSPTVAALQLYPTPSLAIATAAFDAVVPDFLFSNTASALVESLLGPGYVVSGLLSFLKSPGTWLVQSSALGDGMVFDPAKINQLLALIGPLPADLVLTASEKDPTTIAFSTSTPLGGVLNLALNVTLDRARHLTPSGTLSIQTNLTGTWPSVTITFGVAPSGISLVVAPSGGTPPIQLLPTFGGVAALIGSAEMLLPQALDGLIAAFAPNPATRPAIVSLALNVASVLDLYGAVGGFGGHSTQLIALSDSTWFATRASSVKTQFVNAVVNYFNDPTSPLNGTLPGRITSSGTMITWNYPLPATVGTGTLALLVGWDGSGPTIAFNATSVTLISAPLDVTISCGYVSDALVLNAALGLDLKSSLGFSVVPQITLALDSGEPVLTFLPLGAATAMTLSVQLLPSPKVVVSEDAGTQLVNAWVIPLVADLLIDATSMNFSTPLWNGGPTIEAVLLGAQIITTGAGLPPQKYALKTPLPSVDAILSGLLGAIAPASVMLVQNPPLSLVFANNSGNLGVGLLGSVTLDTGDSPQYSLLFGGPALWLGPAAGVMLVLFSTSGSTLAPVLNIRGLGIGLAGNGDAPLLNTSGFRVGAIDGYIAFSLDLESGTVSNLGSGVEINQLGLPLGLLNSVTSSNPVAASLLSGDGGASSGDNAPVNPAVDVIAYYLDSSFTIEFAGTNQPIVIPVHASFGPFYIDQIDLSLDGTNAVEFGVDGNLQISGLDVGVIELALRIPLQSVLSPADWSLDLQGLAVGFNAGPIEISGGLWKNPRPQIEYDGMLSATIADFGLTIAAAYSRPSDAQGSYTSLFMFLSVQAPLGGAPFAFITGLGGGFGYNRKLEIPTDLNTIDSFLLVSAIDDSSLANEPMNALIQMGSAIPARRGSFWIAAGIRLTTFGLINSTIIVAVALDRGFEIDVFGVSRMALPTEDIALVSVELALKARYNSEEGVLSVQAQLTDNSYLFSHDCQLTGGFALFIWFPQGQFILSLGGYNPMFSKPPQLPDVPRLGFNWSIGSLVIIKGGAYFALTDSCVMAGGSLSVTASIGPVSAWFDAYLDFLVSWDPFAYEFDVGVEIGASVTVTVCFFGCATIGVTISVGAQLTIAGPPFHGTATIDEYVISITVAFGDTPQQPGYISDWGTFAGKYLTAGDPDDTAVSIQFSKGVQAPQPPGAQPQPGTQAQPWQVGVEFSFTTTTRMPASSTTDFVFGSTQPPANLNTLDIAPMDQSAITSVHTLTLDALQHDGSWKTALINDGADHWTITARQGFFPEATWHWVDPQHLPAAARTISAIAGMNVDAHVVLNNQSALIPISTLVNDQPDFALPLPFVTTALVAPTLQIYGGDAEALALAVSNANSKAVLAASTGILAGGGIFGQNRVAFGLSQQGLSPLATAALLKYRSAPPLLTPITTGLTMKPVGLPPPKLSEVLPPVSAVTLEQPKLRAIMTAVPQRVVDVSPVFHTSVTNLATRVLLNAPRMRAPSPATLAGARLIYVPAVNAPRPTQAALGARALRNADDGAATGLAHQRVLAQATADLIAGGVTMGAGATHIWDIPNDQGSFTIGGSAAARMICADRSGRVLSDIEFLASGSGAQQLPIGTQMAVIQCLGALPTDTTDMLSGFGAVSGTYAPAGYVPVVGWQNGSTLLQIGPSCFMARGTTLRIPRAYATRRNSQRASNGVTQAADALRGQPGVETQLPAFVNVVVIALDVTDASAAQQGDLAVGVDGATLTTPPQRVASGNRRLLLYDVSTHDANTPSFTVSVASIAGWRIAGVIGVHGTALEWAVSLRNGIPDQFVPEGPIMPGGSLVVTYTSGGTS